jgi:hypothetical protein
MADAWHVAGTPAIASEPVSFESHGATLRGTLYRPDTNARVPAIVVLHGAGIGNADAALYKHLRDGLPEMGIAVLVFDRRGTGRSTGSLNDISYETLADDGIAGARAIARLPNIDPARIGYWGLSQGGWLAVLAAGRDPKAAFAVSVSAPLVTPERQMEFAMSNRLRLGGYSDADVRAMLAARMAWTDYLRGSVPRAEAVAALAAIDKKPWFDLMYMPSSRELTTNPATSSWRQEMDDDPIAAVRAARVPVLLLFGGADPWIPVAETMERLRRLAKPNLSYAVIGGASHEMAFPTHETMSSDPAELQTDAPQAPAYFILLASWLTRNVLARQVITSP